MILTAFGGAIVSAVLFTLVERWTAEIALSSFNNTAGDRESDIQYGVDDYIKSLITVQAFLQVTNMDIDQTKFWQISETLRRINPGTLDFARAVRVTKAERPAFEARMRALGRANFQIRERDATGRLVDVGQRDEYFPTLSAETQSGTPAVDGSDAAADPIRRQLLAQARDDNRLVTTAPRKLLVGGIGFNIWAPVYGYESAIDTLEDRRRNLIGYAAVTIRVDEMLSNILRASAENVVDIYIDDPDAAPGNRFIYWDPWKGRPAPATMPTEAALLAGTHWQGKITIADHQWEMIITPVIPLGGGVWGFQALTVLAIVMSLTIMIMSHLLVSRQRALRLELVTSNLRETTQELTLASERQLAINRQLAESESRYRTILETATDGVLVADIHTREFIEGNLSIANMLGYSQTELTTLGIDDIHPPEGLATAHQMFDQLAHREIKTAVEVPVRRKDGSVFFADISATPLTLEGRQCLVGIFRDTTSRREAEQNIIHTARHDSLTGLFNRQVFLDEVEQAIARVKRGERSFAVLYLDLDHFKDVNDTLGHPIGDELLRSVADRLRKSLRATDIVARFGGDEFAVLQTYVDDPDEVAILATKLIGAVREPFTLEGNNISTTTSVGVSLYGTDATDAETLMSHADLALYRAKAEGRNMYSFFAEEMDKQVRARVTLIGELKNAIKSNQFFAVYQPQVDDETGTIIGVEGLVRWRHPERGVLSPAEFIEVAELSGLVVDLGEWVLRDVCRQAKSWLDAGIAPDSVSVSVNVSPLQFKVPLKLKESIERILAETGLPPTMLELELTEMTLMHASQSNNEVLIDLRKMGIRIAIDDFGTGYSSLAYLIRYPVDRIKIAQEFILKLPSDPVSSIIVKAAINMAHELGLKVVAEGVETKEQLDLLKSWSCRQVQGYYYSKPLTAEAMAVHLRRGTMLAV